MKCFVAAMVAFIFISSLAQAATYTVDNISIPSTIPQGEQLRYSFDFTSNTDFTSPVTVHVSWLNANNVVAYTTLQRLRGLKANTKVRANYSDGVGSSLPTGSYSMLISVTRTDGTMAKTIPNAFAITPLIAGTCGAGNGTSLKAAPTNLCTIGKAGKVTLANGRYAWTCKGDGRAGTTATCTATAAGPTTQPGTGTTPTGPNTPPATGTTPTGPNTPPATGTTPTGSNPLPQVGATPAVSIVNMLAVATHINFSNSAYAKVDKLLASLDYIGTKQIRTKIPLPYSSTPMSRYRYMADKGVTFDFTLEGGKSINIERDVASAEDLVATNAGSIISLEGFNEVDHAPPIFNGKTGTPAALDAQAALYNRVKASSILKKVSVVDFTDLKVSSHNARDFYNLHIYPLNGHQPHGWMTNTTYRPAFITEFGYASMPQAGYNLIGVDEATQAKGIMNGIMDAAASGVSKLFIYELLDEQPDLANKNRESHFGLFRNDYSPKPSATAIHNMTSLLADSGVTAAPKPLGLEVTGLPATGGRLLLQKSTGGYYLILWNEPEFWDRANVRPLQPASVAVNVILGTPRNINLYDPLVGIAQTGSFKQQHAVTVNVPDHPVILEIMP